MTVFISSSSSFFCLPSIRLLARSSPRGTQCARAHLDRECLHNAGARFNDLASGVEGEIFFCSSSRSLLASAFDVTLSALRIFTGKTSPSPCLVVRGNCTRVSVCVGPVLFDRVIEAAVCGVRYDLKHNCLQLDLCS